MMISYGIRKVRDQDDEAIIKIFNYYVENSFAAYPDSPVPLQAFALLKSQVKNDGFYVAETDEGMVVGFALLKHFIPMKSFSHSAEVSYFLDKAHTGNGLGSALLSTLEENAMSIGVKTLLASISSKNEQSIRFHEKHGFKLCGKLQNVGKKLDQYFDILWMQKDISWR